jgi:hypothetical protein
MAGALPGSRHIVKRPVFTPAAFFLPGTSPVCFLILAPEHATMHRYLPLAAEHV